MEQKLPLFAYQDRLGHDENDNKILYTVGPFTVKICGWRGQIEIILSNLKYEYM